MAHATPSWQWGSSVAEADDDDCERCPWGREGGDDAENTKDEI
jgi:hypothetical protein